MVQNRRKTRAIKLFVCFGFLAFVSLAYAYSTGPVPGMTGAPGESNCTECHDSFGEETNQGGGSISIQSPPRYEAGQRLTITVSVSQGGARRWGFQLTALTTNTDEPAGEFVITDPEYTQMIQGENGRWYVEHTDAGTFAGQSGSAIWTFDWIAPEQDVGVVVFYASGNAADNDNSRLGDRIYTTLTSISPPSYPGVTLQSLDGNEVLGLGQPVTIQWEAVKADSFDILFFPRDGALPETIVSGLPGDTRSFDWTTPNTVAEAARIAVLAFNEVGYGIDESAVPFMIVDRSASLVQVTEPGQAVAVKGGETLRVAWTITGNVNITRQQVRLSLDGGRTYPLMLAASLSAGARSFTWTAPANVHTQSARVLVVVRVAGGNILADDNDVDFVIDNPASP